MVHTKPVKIFIIIPLYNEEKHILQILKEVSKYNLPVVVVDDGSKDGSIANVKKLRSRKVMLLEHKINLGKGAAMKTGAEYAFTKKADAIVFMDADGQHEPKDLQLFLKALNTQSYDVVFGMRNYGYGVPLVRYLGNKMASLLVSLLFRVYITDLLCGYKGLTKKAYEKLVWESDGYGVETEIAVKTGKNKLRFTEIPVKTIYHDKTKGVTLLDAIAILGNVFKWRLTNK